ncbi:MAG: hypothetical protein HY882_14815 [Deltaproteobacteria bacterium]|nr:hypothetical protein [Deltaproteobacteria bacterium]
MKKNEVSRPLVEGINHIWMNLIGTSRRLLLSEWNIPFPMVVCWTHPFSGR